MKRPLVLVAAWVAAAAAAVGVGFLAVSLIDASAATPAPVALSGPTGADTSAPSAAASSDEQVTAGGTVFAACVDGAAQLASAPEAGWTMEQYADHIEFRTATQKIEVRADCSSGSPRFVVEGPVTESSDDIPASTTASTTEDSGGHGADDPPGDDHGGNSSSGGHGSDD